jgi:glycosyl transferase family 25
MRITGLANYLLTYWNALRGKQIFKPEDRFLGEQLKCPVFVINLERSEYRRRFMLNYLEELNFDAHIFPAVDGSKLNIDELQRQGVYNDTLAHEKFSRSLSCAEIACTLSHLGVYRKMVDGSIPMAMILEDDAMFSERGTDRLSSALREVPADWDVLQLHYNRKEHVHVTDNLVTFPAKTRMPVGSAGYLIRNGGAKKMLANGLPVCYPADSFLGRSPRWGVVLYGLAPPVIDQNSLFPTEIYPRNKGIDKLRYVVKQGIVSALANITRRR